jgi:CHAT domain-containing protein
MNLAALKIKSSNGKVSFTVEIKGQERKAECAKLTSSGEPWLEKLRKYDVEAVNRAAADMIATLVPAELQEELKRWADEGGRCLIVACDDEELASVPWEALPFSVRLEDVFVMRMQPTPEDRERVAGHGLVVAGWTSPQAPLIEEEIRALERAFRESPVPAHVLVNSSFDTLCHAIRRQKPSAVHLASSALRDYREFSYNGGGFTLDELCEELRAQRSVALIVLNTCDSGYVPARKLCKDAAVTAIGWGDGCLTTWPWSSPCRSTGNWKPVEALRTRSPRFVAMRSPRNPGGMLGFRRWYGFLVGNGPSILCLKNLPKRRAGAERFAAKSRCSVFPGAKAEKCLTA